MTSTDLSTCRIGDRVECGCFLGTIKYIGPIEGKPAIWLGIDWDDPERGKHNGTVNGVQYFTAKSEKSGSFVRPERVNFGKSAIESIESRYGRLEDEFTAKINQQKQLLIKQNMNAPFLEMVGFDKVFTKQSDFATLKVVNLRNQNVHSVGTTTKLSDTCPNVEELDISKNLFTSWRDIFEMCKQLKKLCWLNVSENLLTIPNDYEEQSYLSLKTLICGSMGLGWEDVMKIAVVFPNVEEFRAPYNKIEALTSFEGVFFKLKLLDIEGNKIERWSEVCKLNSAPHLEHLNLENIGLTSIEFEGNHPKVPILKNLKKLCLVNNLLNEWRFIGELNRLENFESLKISRNPITESEVKETVHQIIIAIIANLKVFNGVEIEPGERRGAEYDYIKKFGLEWLQVKGTLREEGFLKEHTRYRELIQKYGEPEESELIMKPKIIKSSLISLNLVCNNCTIEKKMPPTMTVQKLMVLVQKLYSLDERPQLTYVSSTDSHIEIQLKDELKELGIYSMQDGDKILVKV